MIPRAWLCCLYMNSSGIVWSYFLFRLNLLGTVHRLTLISLGDCCLWRWACHPSKLSGDSDTILLLTTNSSLHASDSLLISRLRLLSNREAGYAQVQPFGPLFSRDFLAALASVHHFLYLCLRTVLEHRLKSLFPCFVTCPLSGCTSYE